MRRVWVCDFVKRWFSDFGKVSANLLAQGGSENVLYPKFGRDFQFSAWV